MLFDELVRRGRQELAFLEAARWGLSEQVQDMLAAGMDPNWRSKEGGTALLCAASAGEVLTVKMLLEAGADPNVPTELGCTSLHACVLGLIPERTAREVSEMLIAGGADKSVRDTNGRTVAYYARQRYSDSLVRRLQEDGDPGHPVSAGGEV